MLEIVRLMRHVENALLFARSQGQVEGQLNRLKVFKRQGY